MTTPTAISRFGIAPLSQDGGSIWIPPEGARPTIEGSGVVLYPSPKGMSGELYPLRIVGQPKAVVRRERITLSGTGSRSGYLWYYQFIQNDLPTQVYVCLLDPRYINGAVYGDWRVYTAIMQLPTVTEVAIPGSVPKVRGFECWFYDLEVAP